MLFLCMLGATFAGAQEQLYHVTLTRATPGELLSLIDLIKEDITNHDQLGIAKPTLMRHSQGDQWDLMLIYPIESMEAHFSAETQTQIATSNTLAKRYGDDVLEKIAWQEEAVVAGPDTDDFQ